MHSVCATDPGILMQAFGDPRQFDRFSRSKLQKGDFAVIVASRPGAIYFQRTHDGKPPESALDGEVVMVHLLLGPNADRGEAILNRLVGDEFTLVREEGPDMDGVFTPFYVLK